MLLLTFTNCMNINHMFIIIDLYFKARGNEIYSDDCGDIF